MAEKLDLILISASESVQYEQYSNMPLERLDLYKKLVQLRMVYFNNGFRSHLDMFNYAVNGKFFHEAEERETAFSIWNLLTLNGFLAIKCLLDAGYNCRIINNFDASYELVADCVNSMDEIFVAVSTTFILQWSEVIRIIKKVRSMTKRKVTFILGGAFIHSQFIEKGSADFFAVMNRYDIDYILYGFNSESDLLMLFDALRQKKDCLDNVRNLIYKDSNICNVTDDVWNKPLLSSAFSNEIYVAKRSEMFGKSKTVQMRTASGCPFSCAFCNYAVIAKGYHFADLKAVKEQLDDIAKIGSMQAIVFTDDTFNVPKERFSSIVDLLGEYSFRWYAFARAQYIDEKLARKMKQSGCDALYLGLESGSNEILGNMNKKATVAEYYEGIRCLQAVGIKTFANFIVGFPGERDVTIDETISFINASGLDFYALKEFYYLHSTSIHSRREEFGLQGEGSAWTHTTMNSSEASRKKLKIFTEVNKCLHVDPDMGLWYLIYLREKGLGWNKITQAQTLLDNMIRRDNIGKYEEKEDLIQRLKEVVNE